MYAPVKRIHAPFAPIIVRWSHISKMKRNTVSIFKSTYWFVIIFVLAYVCIKANISLWFAFMTSSLTFTVDTLNLDWNTSFPAITVCEIFNGEKNYDLNERYFGPERDKNLDDLIAAISFFSGNCYNCKACLTNTECPNNFTDILVKYRSNCTSMIENCFWNDEEFECCEAFLPLQTEFGVCYTINSAFTNPPFAKTLISNRFSGPGRLRFELFEDGQIHIHSPYDTPYINAEKNLKETILWGTIKEIILSITEMVNSDNVKDVSIAQRRCQFPFELDPNDDPGLQLYKHYSYSTCIVKCHSKIQLKFCNCTNHLMPVDPNGVIKICDYPGLVCLTDNYANIVNERLDCECIDSCEEPDYNIIFNSNEEYREESGSEVRINMVDLPNVRYIRTVVRSPLDLVISIGGIAGLYFGASILSVIDVIYNGTKKLLQLFNFKRLTKFLIKKFKIK